MCELFSDVPEAIASTMEIYNKVEFYAIRHAHYPEEFKQIIEKYNSD
jgi:DNA polymerase III alpha subunit